MNLTVNFDAPSDATPRIAVLEVPSLGKFVTVQLGDATFILPGFGRESVAYLRGLVSRLEIAAVEIEASLSEPAAAPESGAATESAVRPYAEPIAIAESEIPF